MNNIKRLDHLASITDEMLAGLQADEAMRLRILRAAREDARPARKNIKRFAPALAVTAALVICVGAVTTQRGELNPSVTPVTIGEIAAGEPVVSDMRMIADLGDGASVRMAKSGGGSLFAQGSGEIPIVTVNKAVYQMLETPQDIGSSLLGGAIGSVNTVTNQPSLASSGDMQAGLSNVADASAAIYTVGGLDETTAVAAEVNGSIRVFQRVSYAGVGPGGDSLEETFSVRGKVKSLALDGVGELAGSEANEVMSVLLDYATLKSADAGAGRQYLTATLDNGLKLQLAVSGDTLSGCGSWSCPEFFEAFDAAMK